MKRKFLKKLRRNKASIKSRFPIGRERKKEKKEEIKERKKERGEGEKKK